MTSTPTVPPIARPIPLALSSSIARSRPQLDDVAPARQRGAVDERQAAIVRVQAPARELELPLQLAGAPGGGRVEL